MTPAALPRLATQAPPGFATAVLGRVGLVDHWVVASTPVGPVMAAWNPRGVSFVDLTDDADAFVRAFAARFARPLRPASRPPAGLIPALETLRVPSTLSVDLRGLPSFGVAVLDAARRIPRGEVRSYAWVAREAGRPRAVRAAGTALGRNPVPLLVPCHRVVRADGHIGHYALGGTGVKRAALVSEGVDVDGLEALARAGVQLIGSSSTGVFCVPTCGSARRTGPERRVPFPSAPAAVAAGYRACRLCRPA